MSDERLTYTVEEAGRLLGVGRGSAYEAVRSGDIPSVRIGRRLLIPRHALLALLGHQDDEAPGGKPALRETATAGQGGRHGGSYPAA